MDSKFDKSSYEIVGIIRALKSRMAHTQIRGSKSEIVN